MTESPATPSSPPAAPAPHKVGPEDLLCAAGRKVLALQAKRMRAKLPGSLEGKDPEQLHDLRVALRRARAALRLFGPALGPRRCAFLAIELRWAALLTSPVRDLDVFRERLPECLMRAGASPAGTSWCEAWTANRLEEHRQRLLSALGSKRFARLLERVERFATSPSPKFPKGDAALPARRAARTLLPEASRRVRRAGRGLGEHPTAETLHTLRIRFKKLRYATEFLREALVKDATEFVAELTEVQDCLGLHQDAVVAEALLREAAEEAAASGAPGQVLLDLGGMVQLQRDEAQRQRDTFPALWKRFRKRRVPR